MISVQEVGWHLCILQQTWSLTWLCQGGSSHALGLVEPIKLVSQLSVCFSFCQFSVHSFKPIMSVWWSFNSHRKTTIMFPICSISLLIFLMIQIQKNINFPRNIYTIRKPFQESQGLKWRKVWVLFFSVFLHWGLHYSLSHTGWKNWVNQWICSCLLKLEIILPPLGVLFYYNISLCLLSIYVYVLWLF